MAHFLVIYELAEPGRPDNRIKNLLRYCEANPVLESIWDVKCKFSCQELHDRLLLDTNPGDRLIVAEIIRYAIN